jgi:imidazole glycerol-phosphate synthase subunit HisF
MLRIRVIPCLLLKNKGLVKTIRFKEPTYVGDPINAIKIFNEKEVDELVFLDIEASKEGRGPLLGRISEIATECFMPFCYGGGIKNLDQIRRVLAAGAEKVAINSQAILNPSLIKEASEEFGSQSIVVSIDVKKDIFKRYRVFEHVKERTVKNDPVEFAVKMKEMGAGELMVNSVDRDGTMQGYDIDLLKKISSAVDIPVIACGGAGKIGDFYEAVNAGGASAVAAGSLFVFYGKHRAVLINYPSEKELENIFGLASKI